MHRIVGSFVLVCGLTLAGCGESPSLESAAPDQAQAPSAASEDGLAAGSYQRFGDQPADTCSASVVEVFAYTCIHCYRFEPYLEAWLESVEDDDIEFRRVAMPGNQAMSTWARVFKSLEMMDAIDQVHEPLFERLHGEGERIESMEQLQAFVESFGLDGEVFAELLVSDDVTEALREDVELMRAAGASVTPSMIVNNRYRLEPKGQRPFEDMLSAVNHLIERDRREAGC